MDRCPPRAFIVDGYAKNGGSSLGSLGSRQAPTTDNEPEGSRVTRPATGSTVPRTCGFPRKSSNHRPSYGCLSRTLVHGILDSVVESHAMEKQTLALLNSALDAVRRDLTPRVEELTQKSTAGTLAPEEFAEYGEIVRLNDNLSLLKLQAEDLSAVRAAS